jgi:hypothetical protein
VLSPVAHCQEAPGVTRSCCRVFGGTDSAVGARRPTATRWPTLATGKDRPLTSGTRSSRSSFPSTLQDRALRRCDCGRADAGARRCWCAGRTPERFGQPWTPPASRRSSPCPTDCRRVARLSEGPDWMRCVSLPLPYRRVYGSCPRRSYWCRCHGLSDHPPKFRVLAFIARGAVSGSTCAAVPLTKGAMPCRPFRSICS